MNFRRTADAKVIQICITAFLLYTTLILSDEIMSEDTFISPYFV